LVTKAWAFIRVPATNGVVVQIQKLRDLLAGLVIVQQKERVGSARDAVVPALAADAAFKFTAF